MFKRLQGGVDGTSPVQTSTLNRTLIEKLQSVFVVRGIISTSTASEGRVPLLGVASERGKRSALGEAVSERC